MKQVLSDYLTDAQNIIGAALNEELGSKDKPAIERRMVPHFKQIYTQLNLAVQIHRLCDTNNDRLYWQKFV